jgi:hypothetical protein
MDFSTQVERIGRLIDDYAARADPDLLMSVASRKETDHAVPPQMWDGQPDAHGWVKWKVMPSTLTLADVTSLESELGVSFPPSFRAYLMARFHCFDDMQSALHDQQVMFPDVRTRDPFRNLRLLHKAWPALPRAGLVAFGEWGDGWGPMCFDTRRRDQDGESPIVWLDHELLTGVTEKELNGLVQPLYASFEELLEDVFSTSAS